MELTLLGTAAAEAWPAPFCLCDGCEGARRRGGPNIRTRSGAMVDGDLKIDFCPDTIAQMHKTGRHLAHVRQLVFTHQHSDHIAVKELEWVRPPFTNTPPESPLAVYGNAEVMGMLRKEFGDGLKANLDFQEPLQAFEPTVTVAGDVVLPLPADHAPGAFVLQITRGRDGKTLFYGHDSGLYPAQTLDALADQAPLDIAVFDCTYGGQTTGNKGHMGVDGVIQMASLLQERGAVTAQTKLIATHFSHNGGLLHEELVEAFLPHGIRVAFDGMVVTA